MAKTYGTVATFTAGSVLTASQLNVASTAINNLVVPASCQLVRTSNLTSYTSGADITMQSATIDTDSMFNAGSPTKITINTSGLYVVYFVGSVLAGSGTMTNCVPVVYLNGAGNLVYPVMPAFSATAAYWGSSIVHAFTAGDYITHRIVITGGSTYTVQGAASASDTQTRFGVTWIGRTS